MGKGARIPKERAQSASRRPQRPHGGGRNVRHQPRGDRSAPHRRGSSRTRSTRRSQAQQFMKAMPQLIVCGRVGLKPLTDDERRELLSGVNLYDALETVARLQGRWDVAYTTTQRPDIVEAEFLARRQRRRVRAGPQAGRHSTTTYSSRPERPPSCSGRSSSTRRRTTRAGDRPQHAGAHAAVDHVRAERATEFAGDVPTEAEIARLNAKCRRWASKRCSNTPRRSSPTKSRRISSTCPLKYEMCCRTPTTCGSRSGREIEDDRARARRPRRRSRSAPVSNCST